MKAVASARSGDYMNSFTEPDRRDLDVDGLDSAAWHGRFVGDACHISAFGHARPTDSTDRPCMTASVYVHVHMMEANATVSSDQTLIRRIRFTIYVPLTSGRSCRKRIL